MSKNHHPSLVVKLLKASIDRWHVKNSTINGTWSMAIKHGWGGEDTGGQLWHRSHSCGSKVTCPPIITYSNQVPPWLSDYYFIIYPFRVLHHCMYIYIYTYVSMNCPRTRIPRLSHFDPIIQTGIPLCIKTRSKPSQNNPPLPLNSQNSIISPRPVWYIIFHHLPIVKG